MWFGEESVELDIRGRKACKESDRSKIILFFDNEKLFPMSVNKQASFHVCLGHVLPSD